MTVIVLQLLLVARLLCSGDEQRQWLTEGAVDYYIHALPDPYAGLSFDSQY